MRFEGDYTRVSRLVESNRRGRFLKLTFFIVTFFIIYRYCFKSDLELCIENSEYFVEDAPEMCEALLRLDEKEQSEKK